MTEITAARLNDAPLLADLARRTFLESHGRSAAPSDIESYINATYTVPVIEKELADPSTRYLLLQADGAAAGFSKICFDHPCPGIEEPRLAKLERIYLLEAYHDRRLGAGLLERNLGLARAAGQRGVWLYVWTENARALRFYEKAGFRVVGTGDFRISDNHSNPNYRMLLDL